MNEHQRHIDENKQVVCVMLASMSPELQRQHENMNVYIMIMHLKELFDDANRNERYKTSKELFRCKMKGGSLVNTYVLRN
jgi:hypothetical protein